MISFSSAGAQPEEVAALDEDFYQRDMAAKYEDLDFDAREQLTTWTWARTRSTPRGRGFAADDDDNVVDERAKCAKLTW